MVLAPRIRRALAGNRRALAYRRRILPIAHSDEHTLLTEISNPGRPTRWSRSSPTASACRRRCRPVSHTTDAEGRITYFNEAAAEMWGCRPELGKKESAAPGSSFGPMERRCRTTNARWRWRSRRSGRSAACRRSPSAPTARAFHSSPYPTPLFDEAGVLVGAVNMLVDISDHRRAQQVAQQLASIVTHSDDAIVSKTSTGSSRAGIAALNGCSGTLLRKSSASRSRS